MGCVSGMPADCLQNFVQSVYLIHPTELQRMVTQPPVNTNGIIFRGLLGIASQLESVEPTLKKNFHQRRFRITYD